MTKRTRNGRKQSCKTSCLACTFFSICKLLLDKKRKKEKKENCCHSRKFLPLQMKCFLIFAKVFYAKFVPQITIRESFYQKFRDFLISPKFLLAKVSAPKVKASTYHSMTFQISDMHNRKKPFPYTPSKLTKSELKFSEYYPFS